MKRMIFLSGMVALALIVFYASSDVMAQSSQQIDQWVQQLQSSNWRDRQVAASNLVMLPQELKNENVKAALIAELEREFDRVRKREFEKCPNCDDGGEMGYYIWLFNFVSNMRDDQAFSLFARIGVPTALVKYGDKGIVAILEKLDVATSCDERFFPIKVLSETLQQKKEGYVAQGKIRNSIKESIIKALDKSKHPDESVEWYEKRARECANVRVQIVKALGYLAEAGDKDVLPIIKTLAEKDPYFLDLSKKKGYKGPGKKYLVREEAQKVIEKLKSR